MRLVKSILSGKLKLILIVFFVLALISFSVFYINKNINYNQQKISSSQTENKLTIGVLSIALGRYNVFWKKFYESSEKYFLPEYNKEYFLFTDDKNIPFKDKKNVHFIYHENMGWPYNSLMRYDLFLSQIDELKKCDYIFFFNINLEFKKYVGKEVLPAKQNDDLVIASHWGYYKKPIEAYTYEKNPISTAYIPDGEGRYYVSGAFFGGTTDAFLKLCEVCSKNVHIDLNNDYIAEWHDESHLNKYFIDKNPLILPVSYLWPMEERNFHDESCENDIKAVLRDKISYGGRAYLRGLSDIKSTPYTRLKYKILSKIAPTEELRQQYQEIEDRLTKYWLS